MGTRSFVGYHLALAVKANEAYQDVLGAVLPSAISADPTQLRSSPHAPPAAGAAAATEEAADIGTPNVQPPPLDRAANALRIQSLHRGHLCRRLAAARRAQAAINAVDRERAARLVQAHGRRHISRTLVARMRAHLVARNRAVTILISNVAKAAIAATIDKAASDTRDLLAARRQSAAIRVQSQQRGVASRADAARRRAARTRQAQAQAAAAAAAVAAVAAAAKETERVASIRLQARARGIMAREVAQRHRAARTAGKERAATRDAAAETEARAATAEAMTKATAAALDKLLLSSLLPSAVEPAVEEEVEATAGGEMTEEAVALPAGSTLKAGNTLEAHLEALGERCDEIEHEMQISLREASDAADKVKAEIKQSLLGLEYRCQRMRGQLTAPPEEKETREEANNEMCNEMHNEMHNEMDDEVHDEMDNEVHDEVHHELHNKAHNQTHEEPHRCHDLDELGASAAARELLRETVEGTVAAVQELTSSWEQGRAPKRLQSSESAEERWSMLLPTSPTPPASPPMLRPVPPQLPPWPPPQPPSPLPPAASMVMPSRRLVSPPRFFQPLSGAPGADELSPLRRWPLHDAPRPLHDAPPVVAAQQPAMGAPHSLAGMQHYAARQYQPGQRHALGHTGVVHAEHGAPIQPLPRLNLEAGSRGILSPMLMPAGTIPPLRATAPLEGLCQLESERFRERIRAQPQWRPSTSLGEQFCTYARQHARCAFAEPRRHRPLANVSATKEDLARLESMRRSLRV